MANLQLYERFIKVKNSKQKMKLISAILGYIIFFVFWVFLGIYNLEKSILIFIAGTLSDILLIFLTSKYCFMEFEYSFYMNSFSIAKIYGKKKRKHVIEADMTKLLMIAPATEENIEKADRFNPESRIIAVSSEQAENIWLCVTGEENEERQLIFFEADERSLSILKSCAPSVFAKKI